MDKFLETYNILRQNHEQIENLNRPIMSKESDSIIKPPERENPTPDGFTSGFLLVNN